MTCTETLPRDHFRWELNHGAWTSKKSYRSYRCVFSELLQISFSLLGEKTHHSCSWIPALVGFAVLVNKIYSVFGVFMMLWLFWFGAILCLQWFVPFWPVVINQTSTAELEKDAVQRLVLLRTSWYIIFTRLLWGPSNPPEHTVLLKNDVYGCCLYNRITRQLKH